MVIVIGVGLRGEGVGNGKVMVTLFVREGVSVFFVDMEIARANETF